MPYGSITITSDRIGAAGTSSTPQMRFQISNGTETVSVDTGGTLSIYARSLEQRLRPLCCDCMDSFEIKPDPPLHDDKELDAGDTKLMDDFLHSFSRSEAVVPRK